MTMQKLNLVQGTDAWLEARLNYCTASEAPAMMGESPYMTRLQLLDLKKGWKANPDPEFKKRLFEKGHKSEAGARVITEMEDLVELENIVGSVVIGDLELLASFDGWSDEMIWEHKEWNAKLAENTRNGLITPKHYWQLEHQMLVAGKDKIKFTVSDGTEKNRVSCTYVTDPERRQQLIDGWILFEKDLENHELEAKDDTVLVSADHKMPVLQAEFKNGVVVSNLNDVKKDLEILADIELNKELKSDADFVEKDAFTKVVKIARDDLKKLVKSIQDQNATYAQFLQSAGDIDKILQKLQSHGERVVNDEKTRKKDFAISNAQARYEKVIEEINKLIAPLKITSFNIPSPNWQAAIRGKKKLESVEAGLDHEFKRIEVEILKAAEDIQEKMKLIEQKVGDKYRDLFPDILTIMLKDIESMGFIIDGRIEAHIKKVQEEADKKAAEAEEEKRDPPPKKKAAKKKAAKAADPTPEPEKEEELGDKSLSDEIASWAVKWGYQNLTALAELENLLRKHNININKT